MTNSKSKNVDTLLSALDAQAKGDFESFEAFQETYSDKERAEMFENLITLNPTAAARMMAQRQGNGSNPIGGLSGRYANLQATLNLSCIRLSANVLSAGQPTPLPVPFFGTAFTNSAFLNINLPLPPGVTISSISFGRTNQLAIQGGSVAVTGGGGGNVVFTGGPNLNGSGALGNLATIIGQAVIHGLNYQNIMSIVYTDGINYDTIIITSTTTAYPDIIAALNTDAFHVYKSRMTISDSTQQAQFQTQLSFLRKSLFSNSNSDTLDLSTFLAPTDFKTNVIDVDAKYDVDKEFVFCPQIIPVVNFAITFSLFIDKYSRHTAKGLFTR